ncbi:MAG: hypothetical protein ACI8RP_000082 [Urechidicola sp.]
MFFKQTRVSKQSITTEEKEIASGCVKGENQKNIKLNYIKTDQKTVIK